MSHTQNTVKKSNLADRLAGMEKLIEDFPKI